MPPIVTSNAQIMCIHGGQVTLIPKQTSVMISGGMVMCAGDLEGSPILGCPVPPSPGSKPCLTVVSVIPPMAPPSASATVKVGGKPVLLATLQGMTDGVPPGMIQVVNPGQMTVQG
jgi:hypothetical protein